MGRGICVLVAAVLFAGPLPAETPKKATPQAPGASVSGGQAQLPADLARKLDEAKQMRALSLSPAVAEKLRRIPRRELMIQSLSANPRTKLILDKPPIKMNTRPMQLPDAEAALEALDWRNGIRFVPTSNSRYNIYALADWWMFQNAQFSSSPNSPRSPGTWVFGMDLRLEMFIPFILSLDVPSAPATYLITLHLLALDGQCPAEWSTPGQSGVGVLNVRVNNVTVSLTPLADGSGYVGVVTTTPTSPIPGHGLRKNNMTIYGLVFPTVAPANKPWVPVIFNGITVARLQ